MKKIISGYIGFLVVGVSVLLISTCSVYAAGLTLPSSSDPTRDAAGGRADLGKPACKQYAMNEKTRNSCEKCVGNPTDGSDECTQQFSCDSLFTDHATATKCNFARCENERGAGADYCTCKYGAGGDGKNIGIPLNTSLPFIGRCVKKSDGTSTDNAALSAFPTIISVASRMLVTVILLAGFIMIIVGGVQWASGDAKSGKAKITKVAMGFALLGMMGAILRLINPNFFK